MLEELQKQRETIQRSQAALAETDRELSAGEAALRRMYNRAKFWFAP